MAEKDGELLRRYAEQGDEGAFAQLVSRHVSWLYSTSFRMTGDAAVAEDVTQGVFMAVAQRARRLVHHSSVAGWLFRAAQFGAKTALRRQWRRRKVEARAMQAHDQEKTELYWLEIRGMLETALGRLSARDREVVLLRYYQQMSLQEVGATLGVSEDAARMRVARALTRLRQRLEAMGCGMGAGEGTLSVGLLAHGVMTAPEALVAKVAEGVGTSSLGPVAVCKGVRFMMRMARVKSAAACAGVVLVLAGGVSLARMLSEPTGRPSTLVPVAATAPLPLREPVKIGKETTVITEPVGADGLIDYVKAINDRYGAGVTPENNGYVLWVKAIGSESDKRLNSPEFLMRTEMAKMAGATEVPTAEMLQGYDSYYYANRPRGRQINPETEIRELRLKNWREAEHPIVAGYLNTYGSVLDQVAAAVERRKWWVPAAAEPGKGLWSAENLPLGGTGEAVDGLLARATLRMGAGDFWGYEKDIAAVVALSRHMAEDPDDTSRIFGNLYDAYASESIGAMAATGNLSETQCLELTAFMEGLAAVPEVREGFDVMERWKQLDLISHGKFEVWEDDAGVIMRLREEKPGAISESHSYAPKVRELPGEIDRNAAMRGVNRAFDEALKGLDAPSIREATAGDEQFRNRLEEAWAAEKARGGKFARLADESREAHSERFGWLIATAWTPLGSAVTEDKQDRFKRKMARVIVAAAAVKARTGKWPARVEEMVPEEFKADPTALWKDKVVYELTASGPRMYFLGPDGKEDPQHRGSVGAPPRAGATSLP